jgi:hypothetical protein
MTTKQKMISELKLEFPTLRLGNDNDGYINLSNDEYETTISEWADARLAKLAKIAEAEAKATAKTVLLDRLGITAEEAQLLLS